MKKRIPAYNSKRPSPYSGIVHHLSGRNRHALTHIPPQRDLERSTMRPPRGGLSPQRARGTAFTFITPTGLPPRDSHACCTPWSVVRCGHSGTNDPRMIPPDKPTFAVKSEYHEISASNLLDDSFSSTSDLDTSVGME